LNPIRIFRRGKDLLNWHGMTPKDMDKNDAADVFAELRKADESMRDRLFVLQVSVDTFIQKVLKFSQLNCLC
jgi:hypothetical protein